MDPKHLKRLKEEQQAAIEATKGRITQCEQFKADYKALETRLNTLPNTLTHDIMVPFGKFAFMPGQIVHSNEILVLLGDNWFAERTAKQAAEIANRRVKELDQKIEALTSQLNLLQPRLGFTEDLQAEEQSGVKEIREDYDEEAEKLWDEQHRKNVKKHREQQRQAATSQPVSHQPRLTPSVPDDEARMWARLDELERLENEEEDTSCSSDNEKAAILQESTSTDSKEKRVRFDGPGSHDQPITENRLNNEDNIYDSDDSDCSDELNYNASNSSKHKTIFFTHSKTSESLPSNNTSASDKSINSPADIYKLYKPSSILKKTEDQSTPEGNCVSDPRTSTISSAIDNQGSSRSFEKDHFSNISTGANKAFSGLVVEHGSEPLNSEVESSSTVQQVDVLQPKRMSKFKAKRMGKS